MDPSANLAEQLRIAKRIIFSDGIATPEDTYRLADLVEALHAWICNGGALPSTWQR